MHDQSSLTETVDRNSEFVKTGKFQMEMAEISKLLELPAHRKISFLDVGCGVGGVRNAFRERVHYFGFDLSDAAVAMGRGHLVWKDDVENMSSLARGYDCAVMSHLIEHLHRPVRALVNIAERLNTDGKLVVLTPNAWFVNVHRPTNWLRGYEIDRTTVKFWSVSSLTRVLQQAGFRVEKCYTFGKSVLGQKERLIALAIKDGGK